MRLAVSIPLNIFHAADIYHELIKLLQSRQLPLVKIPRLDPLLVIPTGNSLVYWHGSTHKICFGSNKLIKWPNWIRLFD